MIRLALFVFLVGTLPLRAEQALVAVASNFLKPAKVLAEAFTAETGLEIQIAGGSTGQHYAQILHGAPYDLFLAADQERPALLAEQGLSGEPVTYAIGRLAFLVPGVDPDDAWQEAIRRTGRIAIANPELAPYGRAAQQALEAVGLWDGLSPVRGQNVGQAYAMVALGAVQGGLVALSQAQEGDGSYTVIPDGLHAPIRQDAVLLDRGKGDLAAEGFLAYLASETAVAVIESFGYDRPDPSE